MVTVGDLLAVLRLRNEMSGELDKARKDLGDFGEQAGMSTYQLTLFGRGLRQAGTITTSAFTVPILGAGAAAIKFGGDFESVMQRTVSLAGVSKDELDGVKKAILDLAPAVGIGPVELAEAMYTVSSTVDDTKTALEILTISAKGSAAGLGEANVVARAITSVINSYGKENITAARAADILTASIRSGGAEAKDLAPVLANVVPFAAKLGVSFEEVGANIAVVTRNGVPASEAVTSLVSVFAALTRETSMGTKALKSVGTSYAEVRAEVREKGLAAALQDLTAKFEGNHKGLFNVLGRLEALKNVMSVTGAQAKVYTAEVQRMKESAGTLEEAYEGATKTFSHMWKSVVVQLQVVAVELFAVLMPALKTTAAFIKDDLVPILRQLIEAFGDLPSWAQKAVLGVIAFLAIIGPGIILIGQLVMAIGNIGRAFGFLMVADMITAITGIGTASTVAGGGVTALGSALKGLMFASGVGAALAGIGFGIYKIVDAWSELQAHFDRGGKLVDFLTHREDRPWNRGTTPWLETEDNTPVRRRKGVGGNQPAGVISPGALARQALDIYQPDIQEAQNTTNTISAEAQRAAKAHAKAVAEAKERIADLTRELKPLSAESIKTIAHLHSLGVESKDIALVFGLGEREVKKYTGSVDGMNKALKDLDLKPLTTLPGESVGDLAKNFAKAYEEQFKMARELTNRVNMLHLNSREFELAQIDIAEAGEIESLRRRENVSDTFRADSLAAIKEFYDNQRGIVNNDTSTLIQRAKEAGYQTRQELSITAENARKLYNQMAATVGVFTAKDIEDARLRAEAAEKELTAKTVKWTKFYAELRKMALEFAGDIASAMADGINTGDWSQFENQFKDALASLMGSGMAAAIDMVVPGLGQALKPLLDAISNKILGALGLGTRGRDLVKEFAATFENGFAGMRQELNGLGAYGETLWRNLTQGVGRDNPEQAKAAIEAIEKALDRAAKAAEKYGITWEQMGATQRIEAARVAAQGLYEEFETLTLFLGVSTVDATAAMADELNEYIGNAIRAGVRIPAGMQPIIESLITQGLLTEENARLMLGLADSTMPALADIEAAAERYGLKLDDLGVKVQQLRIDEMAQTIIKDFDLLMLAGADATLVMNAMKDKVQEVILIAIRSGAEIPEGMRPIIQHLIDTGQLIDENGEKLLDMGRLNFAESLTGKIDDLITALRDFIAVITGEAVPALTGLGRTRIDPIRIPYTYVQEGDGLPSGPNGGAGDNSFAEGTDGYQFFGAGTMAMLHGWEKVTPLGSEPTGNTTIIQQQAAPDEAVFEATININDSSVFKALVKGRKTRRLNR